MSLGLDDFKIKYNALLAREKAAEEYMSKATDAEFKKWCPKFNEIIVELSKMIAKYKALTGQEMSSQTVSEGF